ncbi:hypothetical protein HOF46_01115 [Candidatus Woesearchaeota archaeon]|nr:hypothetical protein [Candidatus Woesearchaeota archaeon]
MGFMDKILNIFPHKEKISQSTQFFLESDFYFRYEIHTGKADPTLSDTAHGIRFRDGRKGVLEVVVGNMKDMKYLHAREWNAFVDLFNSQGSMPTISIESLLHGDIARAVSVLQSYLNEETVDSLLCAITSGEIGKTALEKDMPRHSMGADLLDLRR